MKKVAKIISNSLMLFALLLLTAQNTYAHCDGIDGPVIKAAKKALETGNANLVLIWVQKSDEEMIKAAFAKTMHVRQLDETAQELADTYFFETLVRLHRAGEGEPYTGIKPAGRDLGPVIPAADKSIEEGSLKKLQEVFASKKLNTHEIEKLFGKVISRKNFDVNDIEAGRDYVHSYVEFLHTAEHLYAEGDHMNHKSNKAKHNQQHQHQDHNDQH